MKKVILLFCSIVLNLNTYADLIDTSFVRQVLDSSWQHRKIDPQKALTLGFKALQLSRKIQWQEGEALSFNRIGTAYRNHGELDSALTYFKKNLQIRLLNADSVLIASSWQNIALTYKTMGLYDSALYYNYSALHVFELYLDSIKTAEILNNIATIFRTRSKFEDALIYYNRAIYLTRKLYPSSNTLADALYNKGNCFDALGNYDSALVNLQSAANLYKLNNNQKGEAFIYSSLGAVYLHQKKFSLAISHFNSALELNHKFGNPAGESINYSNLGESYKEIGDFAQSLYHFRNAIRIADSIHMRFDQAQNYKSISEVFEINGDCTNAMRYYKQFVTMNDSIFAIQKEEMINELYLKYETEKKQQTIQTQIQTIKLKSLQNKVLVFSLIFLLLVLTILYFYFKQRQLAARRKIEISHQKIEELLKEQEIKSLSAMMEGQEQERKRIATDLHDRVGTILSTIKMHFTVIESKLDTSSEQSSIQVGKMNTLLDEAVHEVRNISHNLVTGVIKKFGLSRAIENLIETVNETSDIKFEVVANGFSVSLNQADEIDIYRIIQELISNILKHSKAIEVALHINQTDAKFLIIIEDNGKGFDPSQQFSGLGLKNVNSRVKKLKGEFTIDSRPNGGTTSIIEIPLKH